MVLVKHPVDSKFLTVVPKFSNWDQTDLHYLNDVNRANPSSPNQFGVSSKESMHACILLHTSIIKSNNSIDAGKLKPSISDGVAEYLWNECSLPKSRPSCKIQPTPTLSERFYSIPRFFSRMHNCSVQQTRTRRCD